MILNIPPGTKCDICELDLIKNKPYFDGLPVEGQICHGILCFQCYVAITALQDRKEHVERILEYLEEHEECGELCKLE